MIEIEKIDPIQIPENNPDDEVDREWKSSYSGKLFNRIQEIAHREGKKAEINNKMGMTETFSVDDEKARLYHRLSGGGVFESGGRLENLIEAYDYRKLPWWREAFDQGGLEYQLVELPLVYLARDAGVADPNIFSPSIVLSKYQFEPGAESVDQMKDWINREIIRVISPKLLPDYTVKIMDSALRIIPLTEEAREARTVDNSAFARAMQAISESYETLDLLFQEKGAESRRNLLEKGV